MRTIFIINKMYVLDFINYFLKNKIKINKIKRIQATL